MKMQKTHFAPSTSISLKISWLVTDVGQTNVKRTPSVSDLNLSCEPGEVHRVCQTSTLAVSQANVKRTPSVSDLDLTCGPGERKTYTECVGPRS